MTLSTAPLLGNDNELSQWHSGKCSLQNISWMWSCIIGNKHCYKVEWMSLRCACRLLIGKGIRSILLAETQFWWTALCTICNAAVYRRTTLGMCCDCRSISDSSFFDRGLKDAERKQMVKTKGTDGKRWMNPYIDFQHQVLNERKIDHNRRYHG